jgi:hypothetical protein
MGSSKKHARLRPEKIPMKKRITEAAVLFAGIFSGLCSFLLIEVLRQPLSLQEILPPSAIPQFSKEV